MHRHRLLIVVVTVTLVANACGDDDDSGGETVPVLPTAPVTTPGATAVVPGSTIAPTSLPATSVSLTMPNTTVPPTTTVATTVPATTVPETTEAPATTLAPETTVVETTVAPETTVVETTVVETTVAPETTVVETTVVDTTLAPETTVPASVPMTDVVVLNQDGLGLVTFGDEPEGAIAAMKAVLGPPTEDTGWSDPLTISTCPGTKVRRVSWGALSLFFGDESPITSGTPHLFAYSYGNPEDLEATPTGLATPEGIGLGSTVQFLRAAYPDVVIEPGEEGTIEPNFFVDDSLSGFLTGGNDDDLVTIIVGGDRCGV